mmetsp:Transcript_17766/g.25086  ORF Transcript_17766/g.25086 Transcript_17766/m.25086 type:complete len:289 (-) Transcript_17766:109-975(-)
MRRDSFSSSSEDDSDDSVPLAQLGQARRKNNRTTISTSGDSSDETTSEQYSEAEFQTEEDSDDEEEIDGDLDYTDSEENNDRPVSTLKRKRASSNNQKTTKKSKKQDKNNHASKKESQIKKSKSKKVDKLDIGQAKGVSTMVTLSSELYAKSDKGRLIQHILCRWWYAYTWPDIETISSEIPPECNTLDGFPGVYVYTSGDNVGKILDYRDMTTCPNFYNFSRKSSSELLDLLLTATKNQKEILVRNEGNSSPLVKDLDKLEKWAKKLNAKKADKEAERVLKAAGLKL